MTLLENREIKGITNRLMVVIIGSVITLTSGGVMFYNGLMNKIDKVSQMQDTRKVEVDLLLNALNDKVDEVKDDIKDVKSDIKEARN